MPWQLAISFSIIANATSILIQRRYSQRSNVPASFPPALSYLFGVLPVGIIVGLTLHHHVSWSWWLAGLLVLVAFAMTICNWAAFKANKLMAVAPYQTISRFYEIVVVALGWIILGEKLQKFQFIGAVILLVAAILAIWAPLKNTRSTGRKVHLRAVLLTLLAATSLGVGLVTEKALLGHMQVGAVLIFGWSAQTLGMLALAGTNINRTTVKTLNRYEIKWSTLMGFTNGVTGAFYVFAIAKADNISLVTAITAVVLPLCVFGAYIFLHERENHKLMWVSLGISFIGLLVTAIH